MIETKQGDKVKRIIIAVAYVCYMGFLFIKNYFHIDLHYYELIIEGFIGLLLKVADSTQTIVKILNNELSPEMAEKINDMLNTLKTNSENMSNDITIAPIQPIEYKEREFIPETLPDTSQDYKIEIEYPQINYPY